MVVVAALVVVLAGWVVPLLLLVELVVVVQGWSRADVGVELGGAGAAGEGDTVLERCKPL